MFDCVFGKPWRIQLSSWLCPQVSWRCHGPNTHSHPEGLAPGLTNITNSKGLSNPGVSMVCSDVPWFSMVFHGFLWLSMAFSTTFYGFLFKITWWNCFLRCSESRTFKKHPSRITMSTCTSCCTPNWNPVGHGLQVKMFHNHDSMTVNDPGFVRKLVPRNDNLLW